MASRDMKKDDKDKGKSSQQQQGGDKAHSPGRKDLPQDRSPRTT
jgi:hypothetical protein